MPINLQPFPTRDEVFAGDVAKAVEAASLDAASDEELGILVEQRLRANYPNAVVRLQDQLARLGDGAATMYAYRDGQVVRDGDVPATAYPTLEPGPEPASG